MNTMTAAEVARALDVHPGTVRAWIRKGRLPARRTGTRYAVLRRDVLSLLRQQIVDLERTAPTPERKRISFMDVAGVHEGPEDLSSNKEYLAGLGR